MTNSNKTMYLAKKPLRRKEVAQNRLKAALKDSLFPQLNKDSYRKTKMITLRVTETEKAEINATAKGLGLAVSEYLIQLHFSAKIHLKASGG